jgi:hypothetical protein
VPFYEGHFVAAMASSTVTDRFVYPKRLLGHIDVTGDTPILLNEHLVDLR